MNENITPLLLEIIVLLLSAKFGAFLFHKIRQPPVLGELTVGILFGNLHFISGGSIVYFTTLDNDAFIHAIAQIGVIILLFEVGLQSNVSDLLQVGWPSFRVACVGVLVPLVLGYFFALYGGVESGAVGSLFLGAILTATSVGITARVLRDMQLLERRESKVILGAAVIDDVLGLILMAILVGMVRTGKMAYGNVLEITIGAVLFLSGALLIGRWIARYGVRYARHFEVKGLKLSLALGLCFLFAIIAQQIGLAAIIGAFAAGLVLDDLHFEGFNEQRSLEESITPISQFFVPVFFVIIGSQVKLPLLADPKILWMGGGLTLLAFIGKYVAGFAAYPAKLNYHAVGFGMVPRGEVGLIFAAEGLRLHVISDELFLVTVLIVLVTTMVTPSLLQYSLNRKG